MSSVLAVFFVVVILVLISNRYINALRKKEWAKPLSLTAVYLFFIVLVHRKYDLSVLAFAVHLIGILGFSVIWKYRPDTKYLIEGWALALFSGVAVSVFFYGRSRDFSIGQGVIGGGRGVLGGRGDIGEAARERSSEPTILHRQLRVSPSKIGSIYEAIGREHTQVHDPSEALTNDLSRVRTLTIGNVDVRDGEEFFVPPVRSETSHFDIPRYVSALKPTKHQEDLIKAFCSAYYVNGIVFEISKVDYNHNHANSVDQKLSSVIEDSRIKITACPTRGFTDKGYHGICIESFIQGKIISILGGDVERFVYKMHNKGYFPPTVDDPFEDVSQLTIDMPRNHFWYEKIAAEMLRLRYLVVQ